jgi:hypothetical protein
MAHALRRLFLVASFAAVCLPAQADPDRDRDGLSDFQEVHKYRTDPGKPDTDGDGVADGDWRERREYQYTIRTVVQVMRPVTIEFLCDDHQDARVLDEAGDWVELEVIHYPFTDVAKSIVADREWRKPTAAMKPWLAPGPTADWTPSMRDRLVAALKQDGVDAEALDDKALVERAAAWLCRHATYHDRFTTFVTAFDERGKPSLPADLAPAITVPPEGIDSVWRTEISARGMFEAGRRGSCSSSAIYLNGCLRALGIPTRIVLCIPAVDANDPHELELLDRGLTHHALRASIPAAIRSLSGGWSSHSFNEVFVGGRWRRLDYDRLGQDIADANRFGLMTHVATFSDWADARMPQTIGRRQTLQQRSDPSGTANPYSTITLRDEFGRHSRIENPAPAPVTGKVTAVHWGDGDRIDREIGEWFRQRGVFGLLARIEGPRSFAECQRLLAAADLRVHLVADGKPTLGVGFEANAWWWKGDHALVVLPFGDGDRRDLAAGTNYRFVPRNERKDAPAWQLGDGLVVPSRE